jgi:hypothetical protein
MAGSDTVVFPLWYFYNELGNALIEDFIIIHC